MGSAILFCTGGFDGGLGEEEGAGVFDTGVEVPEAEGEVEAALCSFANLFRRIFERNK